MKVAVSIPDPVFDRAEQLAARMKLSRSGIYARALDEFVQRHEPAWDVDAINAILDELHDW
jgi:predicted transcriptional regulator